MLFRLITIIFLLSVTSLYGSTQFRVIVDSSASMRLNDPERLTEESLRLIADLAPENETSLGVWLFGEQPRVLLPETIINSSIKAQLKKDMQGYITTDMKTDLESAIRFILETPSAQGIDPDAEQHWILVTDGVIDVGLSDSNNQASKSRLLSEVKDTLLERGIHLHTVSVSGQSDQDLLKELALKTSASFTAVTLPDDLLMTFNRIFTIANTPDEVAFQGNTFIVDKSIKEFTLLVFHDDGVNPQIIKPPEGRLLELRNTDKVRVARSDHYTLITVKDPVVGKWQVENVDIARSNIRVVTNLRAEGSTIAPVRFANEPLTSDISLYEGGRKLTDPVILKVVTAKQALMTLSGDKKMLTNESEPQHTDGSFKNAINISQEGDYELYSFLDGQSFTRKLSQFFSVIAPVELTVEDKEYDFTAFTIKPTHLRLNVLLSRVMLEIEYETGEKTLEEVPLLGIGFWQEVMLPQERRFSVRAQLLGETQAGVKFEYWTPTIEYVKAENPIDGNQVTPEQTRPEQTTPVVGIEDVAQGLPLGFNSDALPETMASEADISEPVDLDIASTEPEINEDELEISLFEILSYVAANLAALGVLGGLFWLYRRRKKRLQQTAM
ncbi:VWA domain-containing protein [Marinomonas agarivorans]|nr:VWA domain-containing protein [Marinomonas agarivorans]